MADCDIIGIIKVPLYSFSFHPNIGREKDDAIIERLSSLFSNTPCQSTEWDHHAKGYITEPTYSRILDALGKSKAEFRQTVYTRDYPQLSYLRKSIICFDGLQRIAAARKRFGSKFWWTVKLYTRPTPTFSHQTKYTAGEIYWNIRQHQLYYNGDSRAVQDFYFELGQSKERILKLLLKKVPSDIPGQVVHVHQDIVESLDSVFRFPGMRKQFKLGTMLKVLALHCPENISRFGHHISSAWWRFSDGNPLYVDHETVKEIEGLVPSNKGDGRYIRSLIQDGLIFRRVKDISQREKITQEILSFNGVIPSISTFHENILYFSIGIRILRKFILDEKSIDERGGDSKENGGETIYQELSRHWRPPDLPCIEVSEGNPQPIASIDALLAFEMLHLYSLRLFPYLSDESPLQDRRKRGETFPTREDDAYIFRLQKTACMLGYSTAKINDGLAKPPPALVPVKLDLDRDIRPRKWRFGKPSIRNFLDLQRNAFLPTLQEADARDNITAVFIMNDFLHAFFSSSSSIWDITDVTSEPPFPPMDVDEDSPTSHRASPAPPYETPPEPPKEAMDVDDDAPAPHDTPSTSYKVHSMPPRKTYSHHAIHQPPSGQIRESRTQLQQDKERTQQYDGTLGIQEPPLASTQHTNRQVGQQGETASASRKSYKKRRQINTKLRAAKPLKRLERFRRNTKLRPAKPFKRPERLRTKASKRSPVRSPEPDRTDPNPPQAATPKEQLYTTANQHSGAKELPKRSPIFPPTRDFEAEAPGLSVRLPRSHIQESGESISHDLPHEAPSALSYRFHPELRKETTDLDDHAPAEAPSYEVHSEAQETHSQTDPVHQPLGIHKVRKKVQQDKEATQHSKTFLGTTQHINMQAGQLGEEAMAPPNSETHPPQAAVAENLPTHTTIHEQSETWEPLKRSPVHPPMSVSGSEPETSRPSPVNLPRRHTQVSRGSVSDSPPVEGLSNGKLLESDDRAFYRDRRDRLHSRSLSSPLYPYNRQEQPEALKRSPIRAPEPAKVALHDTLPERRSPIFHPEYPTTPPGIITPRKRRLEGLDTPTDDSPEGYRRWKIRVVEDTPISDITPSISPLQSHAEKLPASPQRITPRKDLNPPEQSTDDGPSLLKLSANDINMSGALLTPVGESTTSSLAHHHYQSDNLSQSDQPAGYPGAEMPASRVGINSPRQEKQSRFRSRSPPYRKTRSRSRSPPHRKARSRSRSPLRGKPRPSKRSPVHTPEPMGSQEKPLEYSSRSGLLVYQDNPTGRTNNSALLSQQDMGSSNPSVSKGKGKRKERPTIRSPKGNKTAKLLRELEHEKEPVSQDHKQESRTDKGWIPTEVLDPSDLAFYSHHVEWSEFTAAGATSSLEQNTETKQTTVASGTYKVPGISSSRSSGVGNLDGTFRVPSTSSSERSSKAVEPGNPSGIFRVPSASSGESSEGARPRMRRDPSKSSPEKHGQARVSAPSTPSPQQPTAGTLKDMTSSSEKTRVNRPPISPPGSMRSFSERQDQDLGRVNPPSPSSAIGNKTIFQRLISIVSGGQTHEAETFAESRLAPDNTDWFQDGHG